MTAAHDKFNGAAWYVPVAVCRFTGHVMFCDGPSGLPAARYSLEHFVAKHDREGIPLALGIAYGDGERPDTSEWVGLGVDKLHVEYVHPNGVTA